MLVYNGRRITSIGSMTKILLAEDDDMIKALSLDRTNEPFRIAVLPRGLG
jgi:hypothetical protein